jgi:hypothetical protein
VSRNSNRASPAPTVTSAWSPWNTEPSSFAGVPSPAAARRICSERSIAVWWTRWRLCGLAGIALGIASAAFDRPPDILVSADARLIALRDGAAMRVEAWSDASAFTRDARQQYWAAANLAPMAAVGGAVGGAVCGPLFCTLRPRTEGVAALLLRGEALRAACDAAVLVSAGPIRPRCCFWVPWMDRFSVWRDGAQAIWLGGGGADGVGSRCAGGSALGAAGAAWGAVMEGRWLPMIAQWPRLAGSGRSAFLQVTGQNRHTERSFACPPTRV